MTTLLDEVIEWNQKKASKADDPKDKARYEDNVRRLQALLEGASLDTEMKSNAD